MKVKANINWFLSLVLMCFFTVGIAQEMEKPSIGDVVYDVYQQKGINQAVTKYEKLKKESDEYKVDEFELNRIGYKIMMEDKDLDAAEKIFRLNMEEYPQAANPYDSYGDYLLKKGNTEEAKEYFRKSIEISERSKIDSEKELLGLSKGKLAKLENKDKQLDFFIGDWTVEAVGYENGKEAIKMNGIDRVVYNEDANALFFHHYNETNESEGVRILAYDAVDEEFDVAFLNPNNLQGIETSRMKMKPIGKNRYEFMGEFTTRNGEEIHLKHEINKISENEIDWTIFEKNQGDQWQKVYAMNMKK